MLPIRASHRLLITIVALTAALAACGDGSSSGGSSSTVAGATGVVTSASSSTTGGAPRLIRARLRDADADGRAGAGDLLVLAFDREVREAGADPLVDLTLAPGDSLGAGAAFERGAAAEELWVRLGAAPRLSLTGTWRPGRAAGPGASPASVQVVAGSLAITGATGDPAAAAAPVAVHLEDPDAAAEYHGRPVTAPAPGAARPVFGNLHAHTGFSDGVDDPARALAHARAHGLDFMATTDHLEQLLDPTWNRTLFMADAADAPGAFVALPGWEWGHGYQPPLGWYNHVNVVGARTRAPLLDTISLHGLYREAQRQRREDGAIGIFNHPHIDKPPLVYNNWDGFVYDGAADALMALIDCEGKGSPQAPGLGFLPALAAGWHLAPAWNQDNHRADWGDRDEGRTGVWVETLDRPSLLRGLREGRVFSTSDRNARVRLLADGALWMGSTLTAAGPHVVRVEADDPDGELTARIDLWSNGQIIASQPVNAAGPVAFELTVDPTVDAYVFAHVVQQDGDDLFSAPVYIDR